MYREDASIAPDKYYRSPLCAWGVAVSRALLREAPEGFMVILDVWDWNQNLFGQGRLVVALIALGKFSFFGYNLPRVALFRDTFGEGLEGGLDVDARLGGGEMERTVVRAGRLDHLVLRDLCLVLQVDLVPQEFDRDFPGDAVDAFDPVVEIIEGLPAGDVAHREDPPGAVEVRLLEEFPEPFLTHDIPDRHVDLELARAIGHGGREFLLRDLRAERLDVLVIKVVQDEPADERCLPNGRLADEAHLHFHPLYFHGRPPATWHSQGDPLKSYGNVISPDTAGPAPAACLASGAGARNEKAYCILGALRVPRRGDVRRVLRRPHAGVLAGARRRESGGRARGGRGRADRQADRHRDVGIAKGEAQGAPPLNPVERAVDDFLQRTHDVLQRIK